MGKTPKKKKWPVFTINTFLPEVKVAVEVVLVQVVQCMPVKRSCLVVGSKPDNVIFGNFTLGFDSEE